MLGFIKDVCMGYAKLFLFVSLMLSISASDLLCQGKGGMDNTEESANITEATGVQYTSSLATDVWTHSLTQERGGNIRNSFEIPEGIISNEISIVTQLWAIGFVWKLPKNSDGDLQIIFKKSKRQK